ncbi:hypothetical protein BH18VER1_BH18VER1_14230 [soil metagenome]
MQRSNVAGTPNFRIFECKATATIAGLTIANGHNPGSDGGGIYNTGTLTLANCTLSGNSVSSSVAAGYGGGVSNRGTMTITKCVFSNNRANYGGGFGTTSGFSSVSESTFSANRADYLGSGGGVHHGLGKTDPQ